MILILVLRRAKRMDNELETGKTNCFGGMDEVLDMTSDESEAERPTKPQTNTTTRRPKKREPSLRPPKKQMPCGWTRLECFRVEKGVLTFGHMTRLRMLEDERAVLTCQLQNMMDRG
nr:uncharacterized protein LOC129256610 [Lytechinus pictus]